MTIQIAQKAKLMRNNNKNDSLKTPNSAFRKLPVAYSVMFIVVALLVFAPFILSGKGFVFTALGADGLNQHFNAFVYYGGYLRGILKNIVAGNGLVIPQWDFAIGYGGDIISTFSYYMIGDPFALISVAFPTKYAEVGYTLSILLRMYCAGAAFCAYSRAMGCPKTGTLIGALAYTFSAYALFAAIRHPFFMDATIWLPLIWLGVEKVLNGKRPYLLAVSVFLAAVSNFYFFYMIVIISAIYVVVRCIATATANNKNASKASIASHFAVSLAKIAVFCIIGLAMAALLFLPSTLSFLDSSRSSSPYAFDPLYTLREYEGLLASFVCVLDGAVPLWAVVGLTPVTLLCLIVDFIKRDQSRWPRFMIICFCVFLIFPWFGYALNGFGYVSNRWVFAYTFVAC